MKMQPILTVVEKAVQEGLRDVGRETLRIARELSPTETGQSDKSGFVAVDDLTVQVGFQSLVSMLQHAPERRAGEVPRRRGRAGRCRRGRGPRDEEGPRWMTRP